MDPYRTGKLVLFQVSYDRDWHYFEIPAYVVIGIFGVSAAPLRLSEARHRFVPADLAGSIRRLRHQV
jgi:H+/Cl- antiporter ClcA